MRVESSHEEIITSGRHEKVSKEYTLNDEGGQLFHIFSTTIYNDPIVAVVREVGTNAFDAHRDADKADVPFKVSMPTNLDPQIRFRDYGKGMSYEQVFDVFSVYGKSTKSDSSDDVGGFGIGSKSPFAYTTTFFVRSYQNGVLNIYENVMQANGKPKLSHVITRETEEPDGIEVSFHVADEDRFEFENAVDFVFTFFPTKPEIANYQFSSVLDMDNLTKIKDKIYLMPRHVRGLPAAKAYVRMGCVIYPIRDNDKALSYLTDSFVYDGSPLLFDLEVDEVEVRPTREDLLYTDKTLKTLQSIIVDADREIRHEIAKELVRLRKFDFREVEGNVDTSKRAKLAAANRLVVTIPKYDGGVVTCKLNAIRTTLAELTQQTANRLVRQNYPDLTDAFRLNLASVFRAVPLGSMGNSKSVRFNEIGAFDNKKTPFDISRPIVAYRDVRGCQKKIKTCNEFAEDSPRSQGLGWILLYRPNQEYFDEIKTAIDYYFGHTFKFEDLPAMSTADDTVQSRKEMTYHRYNIQRSTYSFSSGVERLSKFMTATDIVEMGAARLTTAKKGKGEVFLYQPMDQSNPVFDILAPHLFQNNAFKVLEDKRGFDNSHITLAQKDLLKMVKNDGRFQTLESFIIGRLLSYEPEHIDTNAIAVCRLDGNSAKALAYDTGMLRNRMFVDILGSERFDASEAEERLDELSRYVISLKEIVNRFSWDGNHKRNLGVCSKLAKKYKELLTLRSGIRKEAEFKANRLEKRMAYVYEKYPLLRHIRSEAFTDDKYLSEIKKYVLAKD